jgi:CHRD domain
MRLFNMMLVSIIVAFSTAHVYAQEFVARITGVNETPAILSNGSGTFKLDLDKNTNTATYELTYSGLSAPATQAHIHFSKVHVAGGIIVWLCQTATNPSR